MKKWKDFLIESQIILKEFNKNDEKEVMKDEKRFTIAYEIEMVADDYEDDGDWDYEMESAMEEALEIAAREEMPDLVGESPEDHFRNDLDGLDVGHLSISEIDDGQEMIELYYEERRGELSVNDMNVIVTSIAYMDDDDDENGLETEFDSILRNTHEDPWRFLRYLLNPKSPFGEGGRRRRRDIASVMGWEEEQLTFDFEAEGGKGFPPDMKVLTSPKIISKLINYFVINMDEINKEHLLPEARKNNSQVDIRNFINIFSSKDAPEDTNETTVFDRFVEGADEAVYSRMGEYTGTHGAEVNNVLDNLSSSPSDYSSFWVGKIMAEYRRVVDEAADEYVEQRVEEFNDNPVPYLQDMGYEEYQYFDRYAWAEDYRDANGRGGCDIDELTNRLRDYFPNFMKRYEANLDFKEDGSLTCGIEFTMLNPKYMTGLNNAFEFLRIFFEDYENHGRAYFSLTDDTGLHTNIGYITGYTLDDNGVPHVELAEDYNLFKALLFLNDTYATEGMGFPTRQGTRWTADVKQPVLDKIAAQIESLVKMPFPAHVAPSGPMPFPDRKTRTGSELEKGTRGKKGILKTLIFRNFTAISNELSNIVGSVASRMGTKSIGFNVNYTKSRNYIEFRYPGHEDLTYEIMKKTTLYYAFLVKAAADPEFKKREYLIDLIGFINKLEGEALTPVSGFEFVRKMKKGDIFLKYDFSNSWGRIVRNTIADFLKTLPREKLKNSSIASSSSELSYAIGEGIAEQTKMSISCAHLGQYQIMMYQGVDRRNKMVKYSVLQTNGTSGFEITEREASLKSFERDLKNGNFLTFGLDIELDKEISPAHNPVSEEEDIYRKIFEVAQESNDSSQFYEGMVKLSKIPWPDLLRKEDTDITGLDPVAKRFVLGLVDGTVQDIEDARAAVRKYPAGQDRLNANWLIDKAVAIRIEKARQAYAADQHIDPRTGYPYIEDLDENYLRQKFKKYNFQS